MDFCAYTVLEHSPARVSFDLVRSLWSDQWAMTNLSNLEIVELRSIWPHEEKHFTPWLAKEENLNLLGDILGLQLELQDKEVKVRLDSNYKADIVCKNIQNDGIVLIENQLEKTDRSHLNQIFTYAAELGPTTIVWIAKEFQEKHRAAVNWLNKISINNIQFFAIEILLWRIGDSPAAPYFKIVAEPKSWALDVRKLPGGNLNHTVSGKKLQRELWDDFKDYLTGKESGILLSGPEDRNRQVRHQNGKNMDIYCQAFFWNRKSGSREDPEVFVGLRMYNQAVKERFQKLVAGRYKFEDKIREYMGEESLVWDKGKGGMGSRKIYIRKDWKLWDKTTWSDLFEWYDYGIEAFQEALKEFEEET